MPFFYRKELPQLGDLVYARVIRVSEGVGVFCELPEYNDTEAFLNSREISRYRFKKVRGVVDVGAEEVMEVVAIDGKYIDLTRKNIDEAQRDSHMAKYTLYQKLFDLLSHTTSFERDLIEEYTQEVVRNSCFDIEKVNDFGTIDDHLMVLHQRVVDTLVVREVPTIHHTVVCIESLKCASLKSNEINAGLCYLQDKFNVFITVQNTKKSEYTVTSKAVCLISDFQSIVSSIIEEETSVVHDACRKGCEDIQLSIPTVQGKQPSVNIGIVGHVAHGKTTLIQAITGHDTRRHRKEISSNRTLNLGYTNVDIQNCTCGERILRVIDDKSTTMCSCDIRRISIVDCPGHQILLSTMLTGAKVMDTCILVVAADKPCPEPQTKEHVIAIELAAQGTSMFKDAVVAQNKVDLVKRDGALHHYNDLCSFLDGTTFEGAPVYPVSAQQGIGLQGILKFMYDTASGGISIVQGSTKEKQELVDSCGGSVSVTKALIVRSFDVNKPGAQQVNGCVLGGSILCGQFSVGDTVVVVPQGYTTKIVSIQTGKSGLVSAKKGGLVAFQTDLNPIVADDIIGSQIVPHDMYDPACQYDVGHEVRLRYYLFDDNGLDRIKSGTNVVLHVLGRCVPCLVIASSKSNLRFTLRLEKPFYIFKDDKSPFALLVDNRLVGFTKNVNGSNHNDDSDIVPRTWDKSAFDKGLDQFYVDLEKDKLHRRKVSLPHPEVVYQNTFTTVGNFGKIAETIGVTPETLRVFVHSEMGARKSSVNAQGQLVFKGRLSSRQLSTVLVSFVKSIRCEKCGSIDTTLVRNCGVKQRACKECGWTRSV